MAWNVLLSGMRESEAPHHDGIAALEITTTGIVEAIAASLAHSWPNAAAVTENARPLIGKRVTLLRRGRNAAGVTLLSTASAVLHKTPDGVAYALRERSRKGYLLDEVILDVLPGWDRERDLVTQIRALVTERVPHISGVTDAAALRRDAPFQLWGSLVRRHGAAPLHGATWTVTGYAADEDMLSGTARRSTGSGKAVPMRATAREVASWPVGLILL